MADGHDWHDEVAALRERIAELLWAICVNCEIGVKYCELGDDQGLSYSMRRIELELRQAIATVETLQLEFPQAPDKRPGKIWTTEERH